MDADFEVFGCFAEGCVGCLGEDPVAVCQHRKSPSVYVVGLTSLVQ